MGFYKEILISPQDLKYSNVIERSIILKKENTILLQGQVLNTNNKPIKDLLIIITELNILTFPAKVNATSYLFTNENGEYATILKSNKFIDYQLKIFEPLIYI